MLAVGREINIRSKKLMCRQCSWRGAGGGLGTGLIRIGGNDIYLYAYRCPECASFDVMVRGKVLAFRPRTASFPRDIDSGKADHLPKAWEHTTKRTK